MILLNNLFLIWFFIFCVIHFLIKIELFFSEAEFVCRFYAGRRCRIWHRPRHPENDLHFHESNRLLSEINSSFSLRKFSFFVVNSSTIPYLL